ncbi:MAG: hypothetical protein WKF83_08255 [Nocardioidaceae bacterium]
MSLVPSGEHLGRARGLGDHAVREAQQAVGVRLHRPGDVDEQHHPARSRLGAAVAQRSGLAGAAQLVADGARGVDVPAPVRAAAPASGAAARERRARRTAGRSRLRSAAESVGDVAVPQRLLAAGEDGDGVLVTGRLATLVRGQVGLAQRARCVAAAGGRVGSSAGEPRRRTPGRTSRGRPGPSTAWTVPPSRRCGGHRRRAAQAAATKVCARSAVTPMPGGPAGTRRSRGRSPRPRAAAKAAAGPTRRS